MFQPIFRPHAQEDVPPEAIFRAEKAKQLAKAAIELRYRLLPYNYTLAFDNQQQGLPLMRPLFFADPSNTKLAAHSASYLWGNDFLVQPIMNAGQQQAEVLFPHGAWLDFYTGEVYQGGTSRTVKVSEQHIPVFVRAGAFVPMAASMQSTQFYQDKLLDLHYYHDASVAQGSGKMYEDDGQTPDAYAKSAYRLTQFNSSYDAKLAQLQIQISQHHGKKMKAQDKQMTLYIHNVVQAPQQVNLLSSTGQISASIKFEWDASSKVLKTQMTNKANSSNLIRVRW